MVAKSGYASTPPKAVCGGDQRRLGQADPIEVGDRLGRKAQHTFRDAQVVRATVSAPPYPEAPPYTPTRWREPRGPNISDPIELRDLHKRYAAGALGVHARRRVSLAIAPRVFVALMGPSGSGKSTLMNLLGLHDRPSGGYRSDGAEVARLGDDALGALTRQPD